MHTTVAVHVIEYFFMNNDHARELMNESIAISEVKLKVCVHIIFNIVCGLDEKKCGQFSLLIHCIYALVNLLDIYVYIYEQKF